MCKAKFLSVVSLVIEYQTDVFHDLIKKNTRCWVTIKISGRLLLWCSRAYKKTAGSHVQGKIRQYLCTQFTNVISIKFNAGTPLVINYVTCLNTLR